MVVGPVRAFKVLVVRDNACTVSITVRMLFLPVEMTNIIRRSCIHEYISWIEGAETGPIDPGS